MDLSKPVSSPECSQGFCADMVPPESRALGKHAGLSFPPTPFSKTTPELGPAAPGIKPTKPTKPSDRGAN
jgi:hypothetical protein